MTSHFIIFALSLIFLSLGSDFFVEYISRLASRVGISDFIIGLTITAIGTSVPEIATAITASINLHHGIIIGNIAGSNIANIGLIIGISIIIKPFKVDTSIYKRDGYIMMAAVVLFFAFVLNNYLSGVEALILILSYFFYILFIIQTHGEEEPRHFRDFMKYIFDFEYISPIKTRFFQKAVTKEPEERTESEKQSVKLFQFKILKDAAIIVLSLSAVILGAKFMVDEAIWIARFFQLPESIIGLSIMSVGSTMPELMVAISAVKKNKGTIVVGNAVGSVITNTLFIIGLSGSIHPMNISEISIIYTIPIMLFFTLALLYFIKSDEEIKRTHGIIMVVAYFLFIALAFKMGWG